MPYVKAQHLIDGAASWQRTLIEAPLPLGPYDKIELRKHLAACAEEIERISELLGEYAEEASRASLKLDTIRRETIQECWDTINKHIRRGQLEGDGWDPTAQRNGMILATNILNDMMEPKP